MKLEKEVSATSVDVEPYDVRQIKAALNSLGYYQPFEKTGLNGFTDTMLFEAIKKFQKDNGLPVTGAIKQNDETAQALESRKPQGKYIWRTVRDGKVRSGHAAREGQVFDYSDTPEGGHPGIDYNCRCWAEPVREGVDNQAMVDYVNASGELFILQQKIGQEKKKLKILEKQSVNLEREIQKEKDEGHRAKDLGGRAGAAILGTAGLATGNVALGLAGAGIGFRMGNIARFVEETVDFEKGRSDAQLEIKKHKLSEEIRQIRNKIALELEGDIVILQHKADILRKGLKK